MASSNEEIRREAWRILQQEDFRRYTQNDDKDWLKALQDWLNQFFHWKSPSQAGDPFTEFLVLALKVLGVLLLVGLLLWLAWRVVEMIRQRLRPQEAEAGVTQAQRREAQESFVQMAEAALKRQDYRGAIHALFLAAVSRVIRASAFHGAAFLTNREIALEADWSALETAQKAQAEGRTAFQTMVHFDEPRWFGQTPADEGDYRHFHTLYQTFQRSLPHAE